MTQDPNPAAHVGQSLIEAAAAWKAAFGARMTAAGFPAAAEARAVVLLALGTSGKLQSQLPGLCGMTKQAVAQHIEVLEAEGLIQRKSVPGDGRAKHVALSRSGQKLFKAATKTQTDLEAELVGGLDGVSAPELRGLLDWIAATLGAASPR